MGHGTMPLVYQTYKEREECGGDQTVIVKPDYPDYFYAREEYGWVELIFPNAAEQQAYHYQPTMYQGLVLINFKGCDWGKCPANNLRLEEYNKRKWTMTINDEPVLSLAKLGSVAVAVGGGGGGGGGTNNNSTLPSSSQSHYFTPNADGQYVIKIKVNESKGFVRITSFVLY